MTPLVQTRDMQVPQGRKEVLHGPTLELDACSTAWVGPDGAGTSMLLRALARVQLRAGGRVGPQGRELGALAATQRAPLLVWLGQLNEVRDGLTVRETLGLGRIVRLCLLGTPGAADAPAVAQSMARTTCSAWASRRLHGLSGGERHRVPPARNLATEAPLLLLDVLATHPDGARILPCHPRRPRRCRPPARGSGAGRRRVGSLSLNPRKALRWT